MISAVIICLFGIANPVQAQTNFRQCVEAAANAAIAKGAPKATALRAIDGIYAPDMEIIALSKVQPESKMAIWDYLAFAIDDERALDGASAFLSQKDFLYQLGINTGVDPSVVVGVWGMETNYGKVIGKRSIVNALSTLGCTNWRRTKFFKSELIEAIRVEAYGHVPHGKFVGSWAGAFGQTQFMPSSFWRLAIDGNGDGVKNIIEEPKDALASTANFLKKSGWIRGQAWGYEIIKPYGFKGAYSRTNKKPLSYWQSIGFKRADGKAWGNESGNYGLIFPAGENGPGFLVGKNFDAVYSYNPAISYALGVNLLSDRIKGSKGVYGKWPTDDIGISRAQKREIQIALIKMGYDIGAVDGIIGEKALNAIKIIYKNNNVSFDGRVGLKSYKYLINLAK